MELIEKAKAVQVAWEKIKEIESKIENLNNIEYGVYYWEYYDAWWAYFLVGNETEITPYGRECLDQQIRDEYYKLIEGLDDSGHIVRW